jgi:hypothetical protein
VSECECECVCVCVCVCVRGGRGDESNEMSGIECDDLARAVPCAKQRQHISVVRQLETRRPSPSTVANTSVPRPNLHADHGSTPCMARSPRWVDRDGVVVHPLCDVV